MYRIATEMHGYTGNNTMQELMAFFTSTGDDIHGVYFDGEWRINNDRAIDKSISRETMDAASAEDIIKMFVSPSHQNIVLDAIT